MGIRETFDEWAATGKDKGMEERHWHTAKHVLSRMPIETGDVVLDLGTGSGYALRALRERDIGCGVGVDAAPGMLSNARTYTDDSHIAYTRADFQHLPFKSDTFDHCFSMEAFYYSSNPTRTLAEIHRVVSPGGTFYCAVNYYEENTYSHGWPEKTGLEMTQWDRSTYREAFRDAGFHVASQDNVPDYEVDIPPSEAFPTDDFETRDDMVERYRELGTLETVGVVP